MDSHTNNQHDGKAEDLSKTKNKFNSTIGASFYSDKGSVFDQDPVEKNKKRILKKTIE